MFLGLGSGLGHNADVRPLTCHPLFLWLALIAWAAQLCLPAAHAAVMAQTDAGMAAWCGARSASMAEQLAQLPEEIREILEKGSVQAEQHQDCVQFCANAAGGGLVPLAVSVQLRDAGLEVVPMAAVPQPHRAHTLSPPVRGPPAVS